MMDLILVLIILVCLCGLVAGMALIALALKPENKDER